MVRHLILVIPLAWLGLVAATSAQPQPDAGHGELLYATHCIACHNVQVHWRDQRRVVDQASLLAEVQRWQDNAHLEWSEDDVADVAHYLNLHHYHFPAAD